MVDISHSYNIELLAVQHKELTNEDLIELEAQRKEKERQKEVTEEPKRFMMQEMARGFSLFETRLVFEAKNPSVEWYTQTFRMQSVLLCHL